MERLKGSKMFIFYLIIIILLAYKFINIRNYLPVHLDYAATIIENPDANNPAEKLLTYKIQAINNSKKL